MCDVCDVLVSCDVLCDSSVTTGCSYTVLDPNICCCLREAGGREGALVQRTWLRYFAAVFTVFREGVFQTPSPC